MCFIKIYFIYKCLRLCKLFFRLSRKTDDHVRCKCRVVEIFTEQLTFLIILFCCVSAVHALQCCVASALQWQMEMRTHLRKFCDRLCKFFRNNSRLQWSKTDSFDSFHFMDRQNQWQQVVVTVDSVRTQMDSGQYHFFISIGRQCLHFIQHTVTASASYPSSCERNDAVRAELVASVLHLDISSCVFRRRT